MLAEVPVQYAVCPWFYSKGGVEAGRIMDKGYVESIRLCFRCVSLDLMLVPRWVCGEGRLNCALISRDAGTIKNKKSTRLCKYPEKMILQLHWEPCGLLLCISVRVPCHMHSLCLLLFLGCGGMPGCLVPGRPVLAVLLFWECTRIFIRLGKSVGYLPGRSVLCPLGTVSGNPC